MPFAVVGSTEEVKIGNKMAKARQYPWGVVQGMCASLGRDSSCSATVVANHVSSLRVMFGEVLHCGQVGSSRVACLAVVEVRPTVTRKVYNEEKWLQSPSAREAASQEC